MLTISITIVVVTIALIAYIKSKKDAVHLTTSRDFFLHGENLSLKRFVATLVSSNLSLGNMVFICAMLGYFYGWSGVFWVLMTILLLGIGFVTYGKRFKEYVEKLGNFGTIHDYLSHYHDSSKNEHRLTVKITSASTSIISLLIALILEVHIGTMFLSLVFGVEQFLLVAIVIMLVAAYTATAGFRTVVFTDIIQFICMVIAILAGISLFNVLPSGKSFEDVGYLYSFSGMIRDVGWQTAVGLCFLGFFWLISTPDTWQRNCASRNIVTSIRGVWIGTVLMCLFVATFAIGGMYVKTNIEGLVPTEHLSHLSHGYFAFSDIFLIDYNSMGVGVNILLTLIAIGLLMAAVSTIDTFLIVIAHVFNVDLGLSLKNIRSFDNVEENKLDSNLLLRGRIFIVILGFVVFVGWVTMNYFKLLKDPLSLFFVIYTVQFCLAIPVLAASNKKTQGSLTTAWVILISALLTVAIGLWGMFNVSDANYTLGMTPASWLAILPAIPILTGLLGYSILYMRKNEEG